jgi:acyl carrier protein
LDPQGSEKTKAEVGEMALRLMGIMEREIEGVTVSRDDLGPESISRLNLDSLALVGFLIAVEDEFQIEWDADVGVDVLRSFEAMARYVLTSSGGSPA